MMVIQNEVTLGDWKEFLELLLVLTIQQQEL